MVRRLKADSRPGGAAKCALSALAIAAVVGAGGCAKMKDMKEKVFGQMPEKPVLEQARAEGHPVTLAPKRTHPRTRLMMERHGPVDVPALRDYAREVAGKLLSNSPRIATEPVSIDIFITSNLAPFTADATPEGDILLGLGVFKPLLDDKAEEGGNEQDKARYGGATKVTSEDHLAFVIAHELAHVARGHFKRDEAVLGQRKVAWVTSGIGPVVAKLATGNVDRGATGRISYSPGKDTRRVLIKLAAAIRSFEVVSEGMLEPDWNRSQEAAADRLAMDLLHSAGYRSEAGLKIAGAMFAGNAEQRERIDRKYKEIVRLVAELQRLSADDKLEGDLRALGVQLIGGEIGSKLMDLFAQRYDSAQDRREDLLGYISALYPDWAGDRNKKKPLERARDDSRLQTAYDHLAKARQAEELLARIDDPEVVADDAELLARAAAKGKKAISGWGGDQPYIRLVMHDIRKRQRRLRHAMLNLEYGLEAPPVNVGLYESAAMALAQVGRREKAMQQLAELHGAFPSQDFYDIEAKVYRAMGARKKASETLKDCIMKTGSRFVHGVCEQMRRKANPAAAAQDASL